MPYGAGCPWGHLRTVEMWSYPVIADGLIYVVDVRNGLYVLRYHSRWGEQISQQRFAEGNSNRSVR